MTKKLPLLKFLRKEISKSRVKDLQPVRHDDLAFRRLRMGLLCADNVQKPPNEFQGLSHNSSVSENRRNAEKDTSVNSSLTVKDQKVSLVPAPVSTKEHTNPKHAELAILQAKLENLVNSEQTAQMREKRRIRKEKLELNAKIIILKSQISRDEKERRFVPSIKSLPPPIGYAEQKRIEKRKIQNEKAKDSTEHPTSPTSPTKQTKRPRADDNDDLDGEERLRLGKRIKPPPLTLTGHWKYARHNRATSGAGEIEEVVMSPEMEKALQKKRAEAAMGRRRAREEIERLLAEIEGEGY